MGVAFKKPLKWSVSFFLDGQKPVRYLRCRVRWAGRAVGVNLGRKIEVAKWDAKKQLCKQSTTHQGVTAHAINVDINRLRETIDTAFNAAAVAGRVPAVDEIQQLFDGKSKDNDTHRLSALIDAYVNEKKGTLRPVTLETFKRLSNRLNMLPDVPLLEKVSQKFVAEWHNSIGGLAVSTQKTYNKTLITIMRWACQRFGLSLPLPLDAMRLRRQNQPKQVVYLELDELKKIENGALPDHLLTFRRAFLFSCYTGLRYSDIKQICWNDIKNGCVSVVTQKTTSAVNIPLSDNAKRVLGEPQSPGRIFVFPPSQNSDDIKVIAKLCGVDSPVTIVKVTGNGRQTKTVPKYEAVVFHTGRRTFICQSLLAGVPPSVLIKWTGHSTISAMQPYIDATGVAISQYAPRLNFGQN